jgi:hypothetical protein
VIDGSSVRAWVAGYERAWRTAGTDQIGELFTTGATYQMAPFQEPNRGLDALRALWDTERAGPNEEFEMDFDVVAVDHPRAVVRVEVCATGNHTRNALADGPLAPSAPGGRLVFTPSRSLSQESGGRLPGAWTAPVGSISAWNRVRSATASG